MGKIKRFRVPRAWELGFGEERGAQGDGQVLGQTGVRIPELGFSSWGGIIWRRRVGTHLAQVGDKGFMGSGV